MMNIISAILAVLALIILAIAILSGFRHDHFDYQTTLLWVIALSCLSMAIKEPKQC